MRHIKSDQMIGYIYLRHPCVSNLQILHKLVVGNFSPLQFHKSLISQIVEKYDAAIKKLQCGGRPSPVNNTFPIIFSCSREKI